jgi:hypothetical protein
MPDSVWRGQGLSVAAPRRTMERRRRTVMRRLSGVVLLGAAIALFAVPADGAEAKPGEAPTMTYEQLGQMVRDQKGKVVVVYFWADY